MKISYNWLKEFLNIDLDVEKVSEILTDLGLEVEGIESYESVKGNLKGVVVGEVLSCEQHPNADRLKLTTVNLGDDAPVQIVCGAPNVEAGQKVPVASVEMFPLLFFARSSASLDTLMRVILAITSGPGRFSVGGASVLQMGHSIWWVC